MARRTQYGCSTMAWEKRGTCTYLYRSYRLDGRVRKRYFGRGDVARTASQMHSTRQRQQAEWSGFQASLKALEQELKQFDADCSSVLAATMHAAGFHRPHRHRWRLRKPAKMFTDMVHAVVETTQPASTTATPSGPLRELAPLVSEVRGGVWKTVARLRAFLEGARRSLAWPLRPGQVLQHKWMALLVAGQPPEEVASIRQTAEDQRSCLVGPHSCRLERLLRERVFLNWLATLYCSRAIELAGDQPAARFLLEYRVRARRLHSQATKDLAELQRLLPRLGD